MKLLFDGDMLVYRMCAACEEYSPFDKTVLIKCDPEETWKCIQMRIDQCYDEVVEHFDLFPDELEVILTFSSSRNYRKEVNPEYKSNRKAPKPILYKDMVAKCKRLFDCEEWEGIEADDVMGIMQDENSVICTGDKDLNQIVGYHLSLIDPESGVYTITKAQGDHLFHVQCLSGDPVDGYGGCPKIGKKKAEAVIARCLSDGTHWWNGVVSTYEAAMSPKSRRETTSSGKTRSVKLTSRNLGLNVGHALVTARMAYILREDDDYNKETHEVKLWEPS